ncbi:MAG: hypothetical protein AB7T06_34755 [Kofleriaceae bacterium]
MNLREALLSGSEHGTDRLSVEADRRLRRRLGLESAARRSWFVPAIAAFAVAAAAVLVLVKVAKQPSSEPARAVATGFVDVSKRPWDGSVTADTLDVHANSPAPASVTWRNTAIVASPDTHLTARDDGALVLARGAIQLQRTEATPQIVDVPQGRVVIASYRSSIVVSRDEVTMSVEDGSGQFVDDAGHTHALRPGVPFVASTASASAPSAPPPPPPPPAPRPRDRETPRSMTPVPLEPLEPLEPSGPPGATPPRPLRPDTQCTFKSECDPGATCRKNELGVSVCMGNGGEGAPCWFDTDCLSQSCTKRRCAP